MKNLKPGDRQHALLNEPDLQKSLAGIARGIEKEGLRVASADRTLALTPHPAALGSPLTNSWATTDFSEALLEFITPVCGSIESVLTSLDAIHAYTARKLGDEILWAASMPCRLPTDDAIPLAKYGSSNIGLMKTAYRRGLGHRYGRAMQTVAGIHYNFSLPQEYWIHEAAATGCTANQGYINRRYFDLVRNFRRCYWLLIYLFGASPCVDPTFVNSRSHNLQRNSRGDLYLPYATSLRMGDLGYQSIAQKSLFVCYNELETYITTLRQAMRNTYPPYNIFGLEKHGVYQQLSTSLLQIENEFYSPIRPKRVTQSGEKPLHALEQRGIEYIEVRCLDIAPQTQSGIDADTIAFLDSFLLACLVMPSPPCDQNEFAQIGENQSRIVNQGRMPGLKVFAEGKEVAMATQAEQLLNNVLQFAASLDSAQLTERHTRATQAQLEKIREPQLTPSSQLQVALDENRQCYVDHIGELSSRYTQEFRNKAIAADTERQFRLDVEQSLLQQREIEEADTLPFDEFLENYFAED